MDFRNPNQQTTYEKEVFFFKSMEFDYVVDIKELFLLCIKKTLTLRRKLSILFDSTC